MLAPGVVLGRNYRLVRPLGRGGMGEVYEAVHLPLARRVAIKTILAEVAHDPEVLARFRREAEASAALGHPNIVQVTDFQFLPGEPPLFSMELLEGETLRQCLDRERRLEPARVAFIGLQILSGLAAAHAAGIVHRDIKPGNVFLQSTFAVKDLVKVVDFGVAKLVAPDGKPFTQGGQVLGTLAYMAPEQASGGVVDARADVFAVGATLFHALSGLRLLDAMQPGIGRLPLTRVAPWVDVALAAVVERALERDPNLRWPSAETMATALAPFAQRVSSSGPVGARSEWNDIAMQRLSAETVSGSRVADASTCAPPPEPALSTSPMVSQAPSAAGQGKLLMVLALGLVGVAAATMLFGFFAYARAFHRATSPDAQDELVETEFLKNANIKPCPPPASCLPKKEHDVTFHVCGAEPGPRTFDYGDFVLLADEGGGRSRITMVEAVSNLGPGAAPPPGTVPVRRVWGDATLRYVKASEAARLCRPPK